MTGPDAVNLPAFRCLPCGEAIGATHDHWMIAGLVHCRGCVYRLGLYQIPAQRGDRQRMADILSVRP